MDTLNYVLLEAMKKESLPKQEDLTEEISIERLSRDSSDIEILDYIIVFLCSRLKSVRMAYKGGYVLMKIIPGKARYSHDIDFSIDNEEQYEIVKEVLFELGNSLVEQNIIDSFDVKDTITPTSSGGIKLHRADEKKVDLGIDIGWHDISFGIQSWSILGNDVERFTVERMLSDKLSAIYSKKRFRRAKDLYDVFIITNSCNINPDTLKEFIKRRGIDWDASPFRDNVLVEYSKAYAKLAIKSHIGASIEKPSFDECIIALEDLVRLVKE